jgi:hypothetical protein
MCGLLFVVVLLVVAVQVAGEIVTVEIAISGGNYELEVNADMMNIVQVADDFCYKHAEEFKLTSYKQMQKICSAPVGEILAKALLKNAADVKPDKGNLMEMVEGAEEEEEEWSAKNEVKKDPRMDDHTFGHPMHHIPDEEL